MNKENPDALFKELLNNRKHRTTGCNLWMGSDPKYGHSFVVCRSSFLNIINLGSERLKGLLVTRFEPGPTVHGNGFNKNTCVADPVREGVTAFICDKDERHGECYATCTIYDLMKYEVRDEENGTVDTPSTFTKSDMNKKYCYENGWTIKENILRGRSATFCVRTTRTRPRLWFGGLFVKSGRKNVPRSESDRLETTHVANARYSRMHSGTRLRSSSSAHRMVLAMRKMAMTTPSKSQLTSSLNKWKQQRTTLVL
jgi:hypothetical protein